MIKAQSMNTEISHICMSQKHHWHMIIEAEWEDLQHTNSHPDFLIVFSHSFQLNLNETSFLCKEGEIKVIVIRDKPRNKLFSVNQCF